jgi:hypothetical protein
MKGSFFSAVLCLITISGFSQQDEGDVVTSQAKTVNLPGNGGTEVTAATSLVTPAVLNGRQLTLDLQSLPKDKYTIFLYNKEGRKFLLKTLNMDAAPAVEVCALPEQVKPGVYILQFLSKSSRLSLKLVVE